MSLDNQNGAADQNPPDNTQQQEGATPPPKLDKAEQARINGAKSRGPVTAEGRARSSQNALKHTYCTNTVVLNNEDVPAFQQLRTDYIKRFRPADAAELDMVETIVGLSWKRKQAWAQQTALIDREMDLQMAADLKDVPVDEATRSAFALEALDKKGTTINNLRRYESQIHRSYTRYIKVLLDFQQDRRKNPPEQNEPTEILPEEQVTQQKQPELTPRTAYPANSNGTKPSQALCPNCQIVIGALMPFRDAHQAVLDAVKKAKKEPQA